MANTYYTHNAIRLSAAFTINAVATDPTTVVLNVQDPTGAFTAYTYALAQVVKDSTGNYHYDLTVTLPGVWRYQFLGTSACVAAGQNSFYVQQGVFP